MLHLDKNNISSNISRFHMFVEKTDNSDIKGVLCNYYYNFAIEFGGIRQMMERLEVLFDSVNFPQSTHQNRSFFEESGKVDVLREEWIRELEPCETDEKATLFMLHIQFRRHSTWQGTLGLIEKKEIKRFRSELELLRLITEALEK